jgi:hypothetical protein
VRCGKKEGLCLTGRDFERIKDMVKREENANRGKCVMQYGLRLPRWNAMTAGGMVSRK